MTTATATATAAATATTATTTTALTCELSGEPLTFTSSSASASSSSLSSSSWSDASIVVVTPSGHVCYRRLLLRKLAENGGVDPFHPDRPLTEDQLIVLQQASQAPPTIVPPKLSTLSASTSAAASSASSFTSTLSLLQVEYDALVLELFDTRRALEETRQELSQALYQNDAAVRVVARLAMERDAAKQQWLSMKPQGDVAENGSGNNNNNNQKKRKLPEPSLPAAATTTTTTDESEATTTASTVLPLQNDIPETDVHEMIAVWERLHQGRKAQQKQAAARAPSVTSLQQFNDTTLSARNVNEQPIWHASESCQGVVALSVHDNLLLSVGTDQQVIVYDLAEQKVQCTFASSAVNINNNTGAITCVDHTHEWAVIGTVQGHVQVWQLSTVATATATARLHGQFPVSKDAPAAAAAVVDVRIHPDGKHVVATSSSGMVPTISLARVDVHSGVTVVAVFSTPHSMSSLSSISSGSLAPQQQQSQLHHYYTCGALHPDGLIYVAGNHKGQLLVWDLKSKSLASTLTPSSRKTSPSPPENDDDAVTAVQFSNNGYHIAVAHASSHRVVVWDLRKQKQVAVLNAVTATAATPVILTSVRAVAFDESGKYLAYSGCGGVQITTVKEWGVTATIRTDDDNDEVTSVVWARRTSPEPSSSSQTMIITASDKQRQVNFIVPTEKEE